MGFIKISILAIAMILLPNIAFATEYIVGDRDGWKVGVNYTTWAQDKMFMVGDALVFIYDPSSHNVFKVNGSDFHNCTTPLGGTPLDSGKDRIELKIAGPKWYICGKPGHCGQGQKLVINVMDMGAPAPGPNAAPRGINVVSGLQLLAAALVSLVALN